MDGQGDSPMNAACASLAMGLFILYISIFSLTMSHWSLPYLRLALAPKAIISFWNFGYGPYDGPTRSWTPGLATMGLYGIMRVLEHSVIPFLDANQPLWVTRAQTSNEPRLVIPSPNTFWARCVYALDLLTSLRGLSWFADVEWSWMSRSLPPHPQTSRGAFILSNIRSFVFQYLIMDCCDFLLHSYPWDTRSPHPMTGLPTIQQIVFSTTIFTETLLSMSSTHAIVSSVFVLCGSSPSTWPPLFDSPFSSKSVREFWARRWHFMFRRVFERMSLPFVRLLHPILGGNTQQNRRVTNILRTFLAFVLSTLLHLIVMHRVASLEILRSGRTDPALFFNGSVLGFFLAQPLGLMFESSFVMPLADWLFPPGAENRMRESTNHSTNGMQHNGNAKGPIKSTHTDTRVLPPRWERDALTRIYTWVFIVWTGRWWCDAWVRVGLLDESVSVPISPLRGLWEGRWIM